MFSSVSFRVAAVLTVAVFMLLVNLGLWQLDRGQEKLQIEHHLASRTQLPYLSINQFMDGDMDITGFNAKANIAHTDSKLIFLDNQVDASGVGYLVYQLVSTLDSERYLLVELGFVPAGTNRSQLPEVSVRIESGIILGRLYKRSANPLSSDLMAEQMTGLRIQNLNFEQLESELKVALYPFALQPDNLKNWPLTQPWNPLPMSSAKHFGYAFQWAVMAIVWLALMLALFFRKMAAIRREL